MYVHMCSGSAARRVHYPGDTRETMPTLVKNHLHAILRELSALCERTDDDATERLLCAMDAAPAIFIAGAGRNGLLAKCAAMRLMHLGKTVHVAGETTTPAIRNGDLLIIVSGSGETGGMAHLAKLARERGARVALLTAAPESTLSRLADLVVRLAAPHPRAAAADAVPTFQPMSNFFEQGAFLLLESMIIELMIRMEEPEENMRARHANLE